jgi:diguanylate cyclase
MVDAQANFDVTMIRRLVSERDFGRFFEQAAAEAAKLVGADGAALIEVLEGGDMQYRFFQGLPALHLKLAAGYRFPAANTTAGAALVNGTAIFTADYPNSAHAMADFVASGLKANLVVPIGPADERSGVLAIAWFSQYPVAAPSEATLALIMLLTDLMHSALYRQSLEQNLARQAQHDILTGLPNRRYLTEYLDDTLSSAPPSGIVVAVLDLDDFKPINDKYGHLAGDQVLKQLADRLKATLREGDVVARLGGDEFVLVLKPMADTAALQDFLAHLCQVLDQPYRLTEGVTVESLSSVGVAVHTQDHDRGEDLLRYADHALYIVKSRKAVRDIPWECYEPGAAALPGRHR